MLSRNADVLWLPAAGMCFAGQRQRGEGNMPAGGEKTVSTLEKTKVRIEISKVLSVFPKVLTVFFLVGLCGGGRGVSGFIPFKI